jgi:hypothetical protein
LLQSGADEINRYFQRIGRAIDSGPAQEPSRRFGGNEGAIRKSWSDANGLVQSDEQLQAVGTSPTP